MIFLKCRKNSYFGRKNLFQVEKGASRVLFRSKKVISGRFMVRTVPYKYFLGQKDHFSTIFINIFAKAPCTCFESEVDFLPKLIFGQDELIRMYKVNTNFSESKILFDKHTILFSVYLFNKFPADGLIRGLNTQNDFMFLLLLVRFRIIRNSNHNYVKIHKNSS